MVILIASHQSGLREGLAGRLAQLTPHTILTAASVAEMESIPEEAGQLDLLLFSPAFSRDGKDARARLRHRFPGVSTLSLDESLPLERILELVLPWVPEEGWEIAGEPDPAPASTPLAQWTQPGQQAAASAPLPPAMAPVTQDSPEEEESPARGIPWGEASLGDYDLRALLGETPRTLLYTAVQRSVQREVILERLQPELSTDPGARQQFRLLVRARAMVSHPAIAPVYEAQEEGNELFYTRELVRGQNLPELVRAGTRLSQDVLLRMLLTTSEALGWLEEHRIPCDPPRLHHIYLTPDGTTRLTNPARPPDPELPSHPDPARALGALAEVCLKLAPARSGQTRELAHVVGMIKAHGAHAIRTWKQLSRECRAALMRLAEAHTSVLPESRDRLLARRRLRVRQGVAFASVLGLAGLVSVSYTWWDRKKRTTVRDHSATVPIPAGEFVFRDGRKIVLPAYQIDRYEVSLAQYNAFLDALPHGELDRFDHPDQPPSKTSHRPRDWPEILEAARTAGRWKGHPITLNAPVFHVDWWDAWAYATWKGRRLPTEEEWEKAARGTDGRLWPWGNQPDPARANTGADYAGSPDAGGETDGFTWWCDVDALPDDVSPFGVIGMAGNVSEWTSTLVPDLNLPDVQVPVFRGGDFHQSSPVPLNAGPWLSKDALYVQPYLGFRTAQSDPP